MRPIVSLTSKLGQEVMITIDSNNNQLSVNVYGELTLEDYQGLEKAILKNLESTPRINLLLDLTMMSGFTVDVAWEDIKFVGSHSHNFQRIAVVTQDQWLSWVSWINGAFTDAEIKLFDNPNEAIRWIESD